jgi:hypothetical protein
MPMRPPHFCGKCLQDALPGTNSCAFHTEHRGDDRRRHDKTDIFAPLYNRVSWRRTTRNIVLARDNYRCQCGCGGLATDIDHIVEPAEYAALHPELPYQWSFLDTRNLISLTHECHTRKTALTHSQDWRLPK